MNILDKLRDQFCDALKAAAGDRLSPKELAELVDMVRPSQDPKFGDYQANCAMPLAKKLGRPPRDIASDLAQRVVQRPEFAEMCDPPSIAGPGFINLRLKTDWLTRQLSASAADPRLRIEPAVEPRTIVIDYSAPNVAKPMHVGHIRSTVIGDCLYRTLKFLGHSVIGDNHIGDWGTQFGMILFGYKHFRDESFFSELDRTYAILEVLYPLVNRLVAYYDARDQLPEMQKRLKDYEDTQSRELSKSASGDREAHQALRPLQRSIIEVQGELAKLHQSIAVVDNDHTLSKLAAEYPDIRERVLAETAKLHDGDSLNLQLWAKFLPDCMEEIQAIYERLGVAFDHTFGESFYQNRLAKVVEELLRKGIARPSEGAAAVFLDDDPDAAPFLVQKRDGAFLYATTDLATIEYRIERWHPDAILYVVDHRQSLHFEQLFRTARQWLGLENVELTHISFGTVLGEDGRPFKTRSGDTVGLESLLDEAVERALVIVSRNDDEKPGGPELPVSERQRVAEVVGIGALKYADLSQNRTSDYVFSYDKMLAMNGNTATYMQYAHARVRSIFAKGQSQAGEPIGAEAGTLKLDAPAERALGLELLRFSEAIDAVVADYRPNHLTNYLFALANAYSTFYERCPVLKADTSEQRASRLALCDLTARTLRQGLALLGIDVVDKM